MTSPLRALTPACTEDYEAMERRPGGRRFCGKCAREVHDFTSLTHTEALAIKESVGGRLCVRMRLDAEGAPIFAQPPRPEAGRVKGLILAAALVAGSSAGAAGCARGGGARGPDTTELARIDPEPAEASLGGDTEGEAGGETGGIKSAEERADTLAQLGAHALGEPMRPIGPGEAEPMPPLEEPNHFAVLEAEVSSGPTAEQRSLTRRKQARRVQAAQVAYPTQTVWMGGI